MLVARNFRHLMRLQVIGSNHDHHETALNEPQMLPLASLRMKSNSTLQINNLPLLLLVTSGSSSALNSSLFDLLVTVHSTVTLHSCDAHPRIRFESPRPDFLIDGFPV
jgi:hypothetical protein